MSNIPTKNGLPWSSIIQLTTPVNVTLLDDLKELWDSIDWGSNYENNRRDPAQLAIYPDTRKVTYNTSRQYDDKRLGILSERAADEIKTLFPIPMRLLWSELTLLVPHGKVPWHHDRMKTGKFATRVMIPITNNIDIKYYFCSWKQNTPTDALMFYADDYLNNDMHEVEMTPGYYYTFNHRVPHKTISNSLMARGMLMVEMIPLIHYDKNWGTEYAPITDFEKTKLLPPVTFSR